MWPQQYDHLYVSLRSGRSVGNDPDIEVHAEPALRFDTEAAVDPEELERLPTHETLAEDSPEPGAHLHDAGNEISDQLTDPDDLPEVDMDRSLRVTFGKEHRYALTLFFLSFYSHCVSPRYPWGTAEKMP